MGFRDSDIPHPFALAAADIGRDRERRPNIRITRTILHRTLELSVRTLAAQALLNVTTHR
ncbi:hypothetical protein BBSC_2544 [Bifidobacterium scardovii JCM 12489 = DSM 13734]|nr:hypothetical protein BBSC_2544 [Bifidobacterium scardovii JCM 12489 = DSM 13734]